MILKTPSLRLVSLVGALVAASTLGACAPLLLGGAVAGGAMVAIDRRSSGAQVDDQAIEIRAMKRVNETTGDRGSVSVTSYNRIVLVTGEVPTEADRAAIERALSTLESVRSVVNELGIGPGTSFGTKSNDTLITGKVKASLVDAKDLQANAFKVVTDRNVVYLMGRVTERESNRASDIARGVGGVAKVVKIFEIVSEAELNDLQAKAAPSAPPKP